MAVVTINEAPKRRARLTADGMRERTRVYDVYTTSPTDDDNTVMFAVPQLNAPHPSDPGAYVVSIEPMEVDRLPAGGSKWQVTVTYSSKPRTRCNEITINNPLLMRPIIEWIFEDEEEVVTTAQKLVVNEPQVNFSPILNSANQPFRDPLLKDVTKVGLRITRNEASYSGLTARDWSKCLNSVDVQIAGEFFEAHTLRLNRWTGRQQFVGSCTPYYEVTYEIEIRPLITEGINDANTCDKYSGFDKVVIDQGTGFINDADEFEILRDAEGLPISEEVPLDGGGDPLTLPVDDNNPAVTIGFRVYSARDFSELNLPTEASQ